MTDGCFTIADRSQDDLLVLALGGELDTETAEQLGDALSALTMPDANLVLDLTGLSFIDSSGLRTLMIVQKQLRNAGGELRLVGLQCNVKRVFELTGVTAVFSLDGAAGDSMSAQIEPVGSG